MRDLQRRFERLMSRALELNALLSDFYNVEPQVNPICALNMVHNDCVMNVELISYYSSVWGIDARAEDLDLEKRTRLILLQKAMFIHVMSAFEACARKGVIVVEGYISKEKKSEINFPEIMERACKLGWISKDDRVGWGNLSWMRNKFVHNNGEANKTFSFSLAGVVWDFQRGHKAKISLSLLMDTLDWMIEAYYRWCRSWLQVWLSGLNYDPQRDSEFLRLQWSGLEGFDYNPLSCKSYPYRINSIAFQIPLMGGPLIVDDGLQSLDFVFGKWLKAY